MVLALFVPLQVRVGQCDTQHTRLRHRGVNEFLAQVVVGDALDAPAHGLRTVRAVGVGWAKHGQAFPPPAVHGVLHHRLLRIGATHHGEQCLVALALVERLFLAHPDHGACIRPIAAAAQWDLVADGCTVDQPANHAHVGPVEGGVIEDRAVFGFAAVQGVQHLGATGAQRLSGAVQVQAVAAFVLHLGNQNGFALEAGCAADPVALGQHAHNLAVRVLADLSHQGLSIPVWHPVLRLNLAISVDLFVKADLRLRVFHRGWCD